MLPMGLQGLRVSNIATLLDLLVPGRTLQADVLGTGAGRALLRFLDGGPTLDVATQMPLEAGTRVVLRVAGAPQDGAPVQLNLLRVQRAEGKDAPEGPPALKQDGGLHIGRGAVGTGTYRPVAAMPAMPGEGASVPETPQQPVAGRTPAGPAPEAPPNAHAGQGPGAAVVVVVVGNAAQSTTGGRSGRGAAELDGAEAIGAGADGARTTGTGLTGAGATEAGPGALSTRGADLTGLISNDTPEDGSAAAAQAHQESSTLAVSGNQQSRTLLPPDAPDVRPTTPQNTSVHMASRPPDGGSTNANTAPTSAGPTAGSGLVHGGAMLTAGAPPSPVVATDGTPAGLPTAWVPLPLPGGQQAWVQLVTQEDGGSPRARVGKAGQPLVRIYWESPGLGSVTAYLDLVGGGDKPRLRTQFATAHPGALKELNAALVDLSAALAKAGFPGSDLQVRLAPPGQEPAPVPGAAGGRLDSRA